MPFDPASATPDSLTEAAPKSFDPTTAVAEAPSFDPSSAQEDAPGLIEKAKLMGKAAMTLLPGMREFQPAGTPQGRQKLIDTVVPVQQRLISAATGDVKGAISPDPNSTSAGVASATDKFILDQMSPANLVLLHGLGQLGVAAAGGSKLAQIGVAGAGAPFAAQAAKSAGGQAGEASVTDPTAPPETNAQTAAKWTAPALSGVAAFLMGTGISGDLAKLFSADKTPMATIDSLNAAVKNAPDQAAAEAAAQARKQYVQWWENKLDAHDQLLQSPQGAALLKQQLSQEEISSQARAKDFLRAKIEELRQSLAENAMGGNVEETTLAGGPESQLAKIATRRGESARETARLNQQIEDAKPKVDDGSIPANAELSDQAQKVAQSEGEPYTPPPRRQNQPAVQSAEADAVDRVKEVIPKKEPEARPPYQEAQREPTPLEPPPANEVPPKQGEQIAGPATTLTAGQDVTYLLPNGKEGTAKIAEGTAAGGRIKIVTDDGSTLRVPRDSLKVAPQEISPTETKGGFDQSTAVPEIEASLEMPDKPVDIGPRNPEISTGTGVPTAHEAAMMEDWKKKIAQEQAPKFDPSTAQAETPPPTKQKGKGRTPTMGPMPDGTPDILNAIDELGGIKPPGADAGGEYDGYKETFGRGPARLLRSQGGSHVDDLVDQLGEMGHRLDGPDDLYRKVDAAVQARIRMRDSIKQQELLSQDEQPFNLSGENEIQASVEDPFDTDSIIEKAKQSGFDFGGLDEAGHIDPKLMAVIAGGGSGAAYGYSKGRTPEERMKNALLYGSSAAVLSYIATRFPEAFASEGGAKVGLGAFKNWVMGKDIPNMRAASEAVSNKAFSLAYSRVFGKVQGLNLAAKVKGELYADPVFDKKLGAVLLQDMQEAKRAELMERLAQAKGAEAVAIRRQIEQIKDVWQMPDNGGIASREEFQAALKDKDVAQAIGRHKELVQQQAQAAHVALGGQLARPGPNTGAFINTEAIIPEDQTGVPSDSSRGNLANPLKKRSLFNKGRTGIADQYELSYDAQVARMAEGNAERTAQREYYQTLNDEGLAKTLPAGERPEDAEKYNRERTQELSTTGKLENTWIRKDIWGEHRQLMNTDSPLDSHAWTTVAKILNTAQLKGVFDPTFHMANIISAIAGSPGAGAFAADIGRKIPGFDISDAMVRVAAKARDVGANTPEIREQLAQVAKIGALREGHPGVVQVVDRAGRLVLNDMYDNLVDHGLAPDKDGPRRDFINQVGQYNTRLMGKTKAFLKEAGVSPFIVAGQNFNRIALRRLAMMPGVPGASAGANAKLIAMNVGGMAATFGTAAAINYMLSGKIAGPPGTPLGAIGWNGSDGKTVHVLDPLKWSLVRRGMRITGLNALANGAISERDLNHAGGQAIEDIRNGILGPYAGPAVNAASVLFTGKSISGFQEAERANPLDRTDSPTLAQSKNNALAAGANLNPVAASVLAGGKTAPNGTKDPTQFSAGGALAGLFKALGRAGGYSEIKGATPDRGPAESALYNKEVAQNQRTTTAQTLAQKWDTLSAADRTAAVKDMTPKEIMDLAEDVRATKMGFNDADRMVKDLGVQDGSRARYFVGRILARPEDQQVPYMEDQIQKGNLTPVALQVALLLQQKGWRPPQLAARK